MADSGIDSAADEIEMVSIAVVAFSVFVQGLRVAPLLRRM
jgi:hypothetical protein